MNDIKIYDDKGYINVPAIAERPSWLKVLIGARQVGKTYGVLHYYLERRERFMLLRRTTAELQLIGSNSQLDPFRKFEPEYRVRLISSGGSYTITDYDDEGPIPGGERGVAMSLPQISHVRGFDGSLFNAVVFDEAIPEKGTRVLQTEGESLLNAYTTISGNRELEGRPPLTLWLLCNTNNINSRILDSLQITDDILYMRRKGLEFYEREGVSIFQGRSEVITEKRKQTALAKLIGEGSEFAAMAYGNEWSYDESPLIGQRSLKGYTPLCSYGDMYIWENASGLYACRVQHKLERYKTGRYDTAQFIGNYRWIKMWYAERLVTFSDLRLLSIFKQIFDLDY